MDAPRNYHNEWSQTDKYYMILLKHGILKKMAQMNLWNRNKVTDVENKSMITKGGKVIIWEIEIDKHIL